MAKPKVSVVITNWNGEKLLKKNLPKVLKAVPKGVEIIVVDDGSTDGSVEYLKSVATVILSGAKDPKGIEKTKPLERRRACCKKNASRTAAEIQNGYNPLLAASSETAGNVH